MSIASRAMCGTPTVSRALRVLLTLGPAAGGMAQHVAALARGLDRARFEVALGGRLEDAAARVAAEHSCSVHPLVFGSSPWRMATGALRLAALVRREGYDFVHAHGYSACAAAALARRMTPRSKLICTLHNFLTSTTARPVTGARARWALRLIARRADRIVTVSDSLHAQFAGIAEAEGKLVTIANGIDMATFSTPNPGQARAALGLNEESPVVGMVGRLAPQKGPLDFVQASALVGGNFPTAQFVLIGDGPLRPQVEQFARDLGIAQRLVLAGHRAEAPFLTQALDVAVVASLSEGSSLTAMEAMAWAKPVIATSVGGVREVVADGETGILVPPGRPEMLSAAIQALLTDPDRARALGEAGRRRVEREFSLAQMIARTEDAYLAVIHH